MFFYVSRIIFVVVLLPFVCLSGFPQEQTSRDRKAQKFYEQAEVALKNKNYTEALKALNMVIAEDPRFIDAYLLKADIWAEQDSVAQQVWVLEEAIAIEPEKLPKLYYTLGSSALRIGFIRQGRIGFEKLLNYAGENAPFGEKAQHKIGKGKPWHSILIIIRLFLTPEMGASIQL
jgi:tetratricopeptide (TPR) repeat protein